MGLFDKLFVEENEPKKTFEKGGTRTAPINDQQMAQPKKPDENINVKVSVSNSSAEKVVQNALKPVEGNNPNIYTLKQLLSTLPAETKKESILGVLKVTGVSVELLKNDALERLNLLENAKKQLKETVNSEVKKCEAEIKAAQDKIEESKKKKRDAEQLMRDVEHLISEKSAEITDTLSTISEDRSQEVIGNA